MSFRNLSLKTFKAYNHLIQTEVVASQALYQQINSCAYLNALFSIFSTTDFLLLWTISDFHPQYIIKWNTRECIKFIVLTTSLALHWQKDVQVKIDRDVRLGMLEPVSVRELATSCHCMIICIKKCYPKAYCGLQPLNLHTTRETHSHIRTCNITYLHTCIHTIDC